MLAISFHHRDASVERPIKSGSLLAKHMILTIFFYFSKTRRGLCLLYGQSSGSDQQEDMFGPELNNVFTYFHFRRGVQPKIFCCN